MKNRSQKFQDENFLEWFQVGIGYWWRHCDISFKTFGNATIMYRITFCLHIYKLKFIELLFWVCNILWYRMRKMKDGMRMSSLIKSSNSGFGVKSWMWAWEEFLIRPVGFSTCFCGLKKSKNKKIDPISQHHISDCLYLLILSNWGFIEFLIQHTCVWEAKNLVEIDWRIELKMTTGKSIKLTLRPSPATSAAVSWV